MSTYAVPAEAKHVGYAVCEFARLVVPVASTYARKADACGRVCEAVEAATGCEVDDFAWFPVGEEEAVWELVESMARDSGTTDAPYSVAPLVVVEPNAARKAAEAEYEAAVERATRDAGGFVELLRSMGYPAAYSRGQNVWCNAREDDPRPASLGMRWSGKRGQWWARVTDAGTEFATRHTHKDELAAMAA